MKTIQTDLQSGLIIPGENDPGVSRFLDKIASIAEVSIQIFDVRHRRFCYISPNDFILCGSSPEDAVEDRESFLKKTVYPADYTRRIEMHEAILTYLKNAKEKKDKIDYFSCTFRLQRKYASFENPLPQMIFLRIKPCREEGELRYLICTAGNSTAKEAGNLRLFHTGELTYEAYDFNTGRWKQNTIEPLTEYEKAILMLAGQGYGIKEMAAILGRGDNTVHNQLTRIYSKLKVHSMQEAIELANHHHMIYAMIRDVKPRQVETSGKKNRASLTDDDLQRIQQYLDDGKSIRKAARLEGATEGAIRYWIRQGKLEK
ncbi:MAG: helix-turn-helix transcriptional regulator [Tannerellaceae bacterium]|jgi:DNA-binding CsgD family transcriptional regulator|nr:helix-turn-helix transcriptional regulator [Tannerellaceae bacterium]